MKLQCFIKSLLGASILTLAACTAVQKDDLMEYDIPRSATLLASYSYLEKHPEAIDTMSKLADKLATIADSPVIPIEDVVDKLSSIINASSVKNKELLLSLITSLLKEYHVTAVTLEDYKFILNEISHGMIKAIDLYIWKNPVED